MSDVTSDPNFHWDGQRWLRWDGTEWKAVTAEDSLPQPPEHPVAKRGLFGAREGALVSCE